MNREQECYGKMFPSVVEMAHFKAVEGKVFGYQLDYSGQVAQKRDATVDRDAWQKCLECRELDGCYSAIRRAQCSWNSRSRFRPNLSIDIHGIARFGVPTPLIYECLA